MSINRPDERVEVHDANHSSSSDIVDVTVNERRRRLAKFAVGAPVLVTLASRPVFAGQCLSNMLSGNLSDPNRGICSIGWKPSVWGSPSGTVNGISTISAWTRIGFDYGTLKQDQPVNELASYIQGDTMSKLPLLNKDLVKSNVYLRELLAVDDPNRQLTRYLVCAYFNALLGALSGSTFHYILTPQQVLGLASGAISLPTGYSLESFLGSTWA